MTGMMLAALLAPAAEMTPLEPSSKWLLDPIRRVCQLTRSFGQGPQVTFTISRGPLSTWTTFDIVTTTVPNIRDHSLKATLRDETTGREFVGEAQIGIIKDRPERQLTVFGVDQSFMTSLGNDSVLSFRLNGRPVAAVRPKDLPTALRAHHRCEEDLWRQWGIDPAVIASLKSLPVPSNNPSTWVTNSDYPLSALASNSEGPSTVRYRVTLDGRVKDCTVAQSSGDPSLDATTCDLLTKRAIYRPAIDADGKFTETWLANTIWWSIRPRG